MTTENAWRSVHDHAARLKQKTLPAELTASTF